MGLPTPEDLRYQPHDSDIVLSTAQTTSSCPPLQENDHCGSEDGDGDNDFCGDDGSTPQSTRCKMRTMHIATFDSNHNVLIPQRVQAVDDIYVENVALGPNHMICLGTKRALGESAVVGRTLYEVQEARRTTRLFPSFIDGGSASVSAPANALHASEKPDGFDDNFRRSEDTRMSTDGHFPSSDCQSSQHEVLNFVTGDDSESQDQESPPNLNEARAATNIPETSDEITLKEIDLDWQQLTSSQRSDTVLVHNSPAANAAKFVTLESKLSPESGCVATTVDCDSRDSLITDQGTKTAGKGKRSGIMKCLSRSFFGQRQWNLKSDETRPGARTKPTRASETKLK
jgi:hypothetical protein